MLGRIKSLAGSGAQLPVLQQVGTPKLLNGKSAYTVTGTTAITGLSTANPILPGRIITLMGTHATGPAFTDTAVGSTANGAIHLSAALTLANGSHVTLQQANNGSWWEIARSVNG